MKSIFFIYTGITMFVTELRMIVIEEPQQTEWPLSQPAGYLRGKTLFCKSCNIENRAVDQPKTP